MRKSFCQQFKDGDCGCISGRFLRIQAFKQNGQGINREKTGLLKKTPAIKKIIVRHDLF